MNLFAWNLIKKTVCYKDKRIYSIMHVNFNYKQRKKINKKSDIWAEYIYLLV